MDSKREHTACFTGHRVVSKADLPQVTVKLDETIAQLISEGIVFFGAGMARGFDTLAAKAVLKARESNPDVKLIAVLPCSEQDALWNEKEKQEYRDLLTAADKTVC